MNATRAAVDSGKAVGGVAAGTTRIQGAAPLAAGEAAANGEVWAPTQINAPSTAVNGSARTLIVCNQGPMKKDYRDSARDSKVSH